jgi:hypothetical protein
MCSCWYRTDAADGVYRYSATALEEAKLVMATENREGPLFIALAVIFACCSAGANNSVVVQLMTGTDDS